MLAGVLLAYTIERVECPAPAPTWNTQTVRDAGGQEWLIRRNAERRSALGYCTFSVVAVPGNKP
jgi:hypothetical protein